MFYLFIVIQILLSENNFDDFIKEIEKDVSVSILVQDKDGSILYEKNANKIVSSASLIKVPIFYYYYLSKSKIEKKHILLSEEIVGGSGDMQYETPNTVFKTKRIAEWMITKSDNTATNILIEELGMGSINEFIQEMGMKDTKLQRKMMDFKAALAGKDNLTTATDMNLAFLKLLNQQILSKSDGKKAVLTFINCEDKTTIPKKIAPTIPIAHKTGTLDTIRSDSGIIFGDKICVYTVFISDFQSIEQAEGILADIGMKMFEEFCN